MNPRVRQSGFALLLVLIVLATSVVLGASYLYAAAMYQTATKSFPDGQRARYLAESGINHAAYLLREHPEQLNGSDVTPLGPYTADTEGGTYTISSKSTGNPNQYLLESKGTCGRATVTCHLTAYKATETATTDVLHGLLVQYYSSTLASSFTINGPVQVNGSFTNRGKISGTTKVTGTLYNYGTITPAATSHALTLAPPTVVGSSYYNYKYDGKNGAAAIITSTSLGSSSSITNGKSITTANPAGVVVVRPNNKNRTVTIDSNFHFTGTLIVEGTMKMQNDGITFDPKPGFPAIIVSSNITLRSGVKATINGLVWAGTGLRNSSTSSSSKITINGALVCPSGYIASGIKGNHTINYDADSVSLVSPSGAQEHPTIQFVNWNE